MFVSQAALRRTALTVAAAASLLLAPATLASAAEMDSEPTTRANVLQVEAAAPRASTPFPVLPAIAKFEAHDRGTGFAPAAGAVQDSGVFGRFDTWVSRVGAGIHTCPKSTCKVLEVNQPATFLVDFCWVAGERLGGNRYWDLVYNKATGRAGWTNQRWLTTYNVQSRKCSDPVLGGGDPYATGQGKAGAGMHDCRSNTCALTGMAAARTVTIFCWQGGQTLGGSPTWDLVYTAAPNGDTGAAGWTNEAWLYGNSGVRC